MLGSLISAGSSLIGGLLGKSNADKQMAMQKQFAQKGLQWKAADAEKAGISKIFAMGAPAISYAPVSAGGALGASVADAGQQIGRAMDATSSPQGRASTMAVELAKAQIEGVKIDNQIKLANLRSQVALRNQAGNPPPIPDSETIQHIPGQGNSEIKVEKKIAPSGAQPFKSYGVSPEVDLYRTARGWSPQVPSELGEAMESQPIAALQWAIRNNILPQFDSSRKVGAQGDPPPGMRWHYNMFTGEYSWVPMSEGYKRALRRIPDYTK